MTRQALQRALRRLDDRANPAMVREVRALVRGKVSLAVLWVCLGALLVVYVATVAIYGSGGRGLFVGSMVILGLMALAVIPGALGGSLGRDLRSHALEMEQLTGVGAWRMVWGRLLAGAVAAAFAASLVAPFIAASLVFGGVAPGVALACLYGVLVLSPLVCALSVLGGTQPPGTHQEGARRGSFASSYLGLSIVVGLAVALIGPSLSGALTVPSAGAAVAWIACGTAVWFWLLLLVCATARERLTFPADRSAALSKALLLGLVLSLAASAAVLRGGGWTSRSQAGMGFQLLACGFAAACCLNWMMAAPGAPRRLRPLLGRARSPLLAFPLADGAGGTAVYFVCLMAVVAGAAALLRGVGASRGPLAIARRDWVVACAGYPVPLTLAFVLYCSAAADALVRPFEPHRRTQKSRSVALALFLLSGVGLLAAITAWRKADPAALNGPAAAFFPALYLFTLEARPPLPELLAHLTGPLAAGLAYHVAIGVPQYRAFVRTIRRAREGD